MVNVDKRISSRGIIIEDGYLYAMFRRRIKEDGSVKEYYVIPGGGIEEGETKDTIEHFFACTIVDGTPKLGGEEKEKCSESNYYEIRKVRVLELDNIDISFKDMIRKCYEEYK